MWYKYSMVVLMLGTIIMASMVGAAPEDNNKKTGFDVYIESMGFTLVSYQISDKYKDDTDKFVVLDIIIADNFNNEYSYKWVMTYEKYLERREKV